MKMTIVHLLSQTHLTGAESHALALTEAQQADGHSVYLVSDRIHLPTKASHFARPIHSAKRGLKLWREIRWLRAFCREHRVDIVHAHSRAAVRVAWWATRGTSTALVSTVHGRQHFSLGKRFFDRYGERVIAVCENIRFHLMRDFGMRAERVSVIGNPVSMLEAEAASPYRWLLVTRWTGPKGEKSLELLDKVCAPLLEENPTLHLDVCAAEPEPGSAAAQEIARFENRFSSRFRFRGLLTDIESEYKNYGLIFGGGRIAIGALGSRRACFAFGEIATLGLVTPTNFKAAQYSNFGDIAFEDQPASLSLTESRQQLEAFLKAPGLPDLEVVLATRERYSKRAVHTRVLEVYASARFMKHHPWPIPVLMYHQVVDKPINTKHRIFVTKDTFEAHLKTLKRMGTSFLTFQDLEDFKVGRKDMSDFPRRPVILTFDDGYENNLRNALPVLRRNDARGVIYLLADKTLTSNSWDEGEVPPSALLNEQQRLDVAHSGVFEIGSHGFRHEKLTEMSRDQALKELKDSRSVLEKELGVPVPSFAFTYGAIDDRSADLAREAGYPYAVNTDQGGIHIEENPWSVFRVNIFPEDGPLSVLKKARPAYRWRFYRKHRR